MIFYILLFIAILIYLFFTLNTIIWLKDKKITNVNDKIIKYMNYFNFILFSLLLVFLLYIYIVNKNIIIK
uniref:Uncharacterized protein n=1 Tax=viral metagenome TaxID=1070528 RepID=A0A6C0CE43_9ZZZZ